MFEDFSPPEKGLNEDEAVVWSRRAGMAARWMLGGGCCIVSCPWILLVTYTAVGPLIGNAVLLIILIGLFLTILEFINSRRTKYFLTSTRLVEARGGLLRSQIPLEAFQGVNLDEYIEIKSTYREGAEYFFQARIKNPITGKHMILTGLDEDSRDLLLKLATSKT